MLNKDGIFFLLAICLFSTPHAGLAGNDLISNNLARTELRLGTGLLNGESGEYVYDADGTGSGIPGYKVSELNWQLNNVNMVGIGASIIPNPRLRFNVDYWSNAGDGDGTMDDYDWLYVGLDWSHWSHHSDTTVTDVSSLDVNGEFTLFSFDKEKTYITALLGYKQDKLAWEAVGGYGIYSDLNALGYRDLPVVFPNVPGISYEQTYNMPYVGLGVRSVGNSRAMPIVLSASFRYSNQVHGEDVDIHHLRDLRFEESGDDGIWQAYDIRIDFHFSPSLSFNLSYAAQRYAEIEATTEVTDLITGAKTFYPGPAAGLDHHSSMRSLGLTYLF